MSRGKNAALNPIFNYKKPVFLLICFRLRCGSYYLLYLISQRFHDLENHLPQKSQWGHSTIFWGIWLSKLQYCHRFFTAEKVYKNHYDIFERYRNALPTRIPIRQTDGQANLLDNDDRYYYFHTRHYLFRQAVSDHTRLIIYTLIAINCAFHFFNSFLNHQSALVNAVQYFSIQFTST